MRCILALFVLWSVQAQAGPAPAPEFHYNESVHHGLGFTLSQYDSQFQDLFGPDTQKSALCWPVSFANTVAYLRYGRENPFTKLLMPGERLPSGAIDHYGDQLRYFSYLCHTDLEDGTNSSNAKRCVRDYFKASGYDHSKIRLIGYEGLSARDKRAVSVDDIREYIQRDFGVILEIGYYRYDPDQKGWQRHGGHFLSVAGYDYNPSWKDQYIQLDLVDPALDYSRKASKAWTQMLMLKLPSAREKPYHYPANIQYFLSAPRYSAYSANNSLALIENVLVFLPE